MYWNKRLLLIVALLFVVFGNVLAQSPYRIRLADSTYAAQLRGVTGTRTAGITITGTYKSNFRAHQFNVTTTGRYDLYIDATGTGSSYTKDAVWSGTVGKSVTGKTDLERTVSLGVYADPDSNAQIDTQGYEDLSVTAPKLASVLDLSSKTITYPESLLALNNMTTATVNFIGSGGSITNNPDDESTENKSGSTIGFKDSYFADLSRKEASTALVTEYGAVPDDGNSDVTAIQNAITAAIAGGLDTATVYFPTGVYNIDNTITLANGGNNQSSIRMLFSPGAKLRMSVEDTLFNLTGFTGGFVFEGGQFVGQKAYTQDNNSVFFSHTDSTTSGGYTFRDIRVDSIGTVFDLYDVTRIKVTDSEFREANVIVRAGYNSDGFFFDGNTFWRSDTVAYVYGSSSDIGVWINNVFGYSNYGYIHVGGGGFTIKGGYWEGVKNLGIVGDGTGGSRNVNIEGVTYQGQSLNETGWTFYDDDRITVTGCKVSGIEDTTYLFLDNAATAVFINNHGGSADFNASVPLTSVSGKIVTWNVPGEQFGNTYLGVPSAESFYLAAAFSPKGAMYVDTVNADGGSIARMVIDNRAGSNYFYNLTPKQNVEYFLPRQMAPFVNGFVSSNYAVLDTFQTGSNNYSYEFYSFVDGTDKYVAVDFIVDPTLYTSDSMYIDIFWKADTVAGTVGWGTAYQIMRTDGAADPSGFISTQYKSATVTSTLSQLNVTTIPVLASGLVAGAICKVSIRRDGDGSSVTDSILLPAKLMAIRIRYGRQ